MLLPANDRRKPVDQAVIDRAMTQVAQDLAALNDPTNKSRPGKPYSVAEIVALAPSGLEDLRDAMVNRDDQRAEVALRQLSAVMVFYYAAMMAKGVEV